MSMATGVSICSNALLMLGAQTINDFNDQLNLDRAKLCANLYPTVRDDMLRQHPWNCCIKRIVLAPDAAAPAFGYEHAFELPADFLRVLEVGSGGQQIDYRVEGRTIQADTTALELRYIFRNEVENTWDVNLIKLVTLAMASVLAYPVTQSTALQQALEQQLEMEKRRARAVDGQEDPPQTLGDERLLAARFGGGW
ncbi:hypothetical protein FBY06_11546 [Pseudomonas sp. SJZ085]|uniref:hypothetical protein n=1 Tax=unclassified Pseudomonas TaxID=196821 RepID=UPI0011998C25|nr:MULTISPECIES: hypothetical protein [unclassified Pseudomonas]TWC18121.1 hypothetical protein FBX99_11546 [Pseudomonas sp. SJZ074]TWC36093.1 hypothetical protein FBY06_11546 [Pseudomonas sp. SJZ085]